MLHSLGLGLFARRGRLDSQLVRAERWRLLRPVRGWLATYAMRRASCCRSTMTWRGYTVHSGFGSVRRWLFTTRVGQPFSARETSTGARGRQLDISAAKLVS